MRSSIIALLAVAASYPATAHAQSTAVSPACSVRFVQAPADVRAVVETWLAAEPRCATELEVRIVATDGGLYLFANDAGGRIHERVVPDAQTAGVLIASWAADDAAPPPSSPPEAPARTLPPPAISPPGLAVQRSAPPRPAITSQRWLTVGAMTEAIGTGYGIRGELDLIERQGWTLGIAAGVTHSDLDVDDGYAHTAVTTLDIDVVGRIAYTAHFASFDLSGAMGAGLVMTQASSQMSSTGVSPAVEASVTVTVPMGPTWAVTAAPIASIYEQTLQATDNAIGLASRDPVLVLMFGIKHRL